MTDLRFEIYPGATPTSGLLATFNKDDYEEGSGLRQELNGTGSGQLVVHGSHVDVTAANFTRGNYVKVIDLDLGAGEGIGGFFLTEGEFIAVSRKEIGGRVLTFGGPGALAYLSKAAMDAVPYVSSGSGEYNGPRDDMLWHWGQHSDLTFDKIGAILKRVIDEFQHASRPTDPIPALTYDFDYDDDSASTPWDDLEPGGFTLAVGQNGLSCTEQFMRAGVTILAHPNLLLQAFTDEYGTDRSSATFAAGKVRWVHGTNIAVGTSGDVKHAIHESPQLRRLLVAGEGAIPATVVTVTDAGAPLEKEGFLSTSGSGDTYLAEVGATDLALRAAETATAIFSHKPGDAELTGDYTPGWPGGAGHYWLGDTVRYHTGTNAHDFNEQNLRVAAIAWKLRAGSDWEIQVELGSTYYSISQPKIPGITAPGGAGCVCPHPPSGGYEFGTPPTTDVEWHFGSGTTHVPGDGSYGNNEDDGGTYAWFSRWSTSEHADVGTVGGTMGIVKTGGYTLVPVTAATTYAISCRLGQRGTTHAEVKLIAQWWTATTGGSQIGADVEVGGSTAVNFAWQNVANSLVAPGGAVGLHLGVPYIQAQIDDLVVTHGTGADTFAGDSPPPASDDATGSIGTDFGCYALCDHQHPWQSAVSTPMFDEGGYYTGVTVEEALQEVPAIAAAAAVAAVTDAAIQALGHFEVIVSGTAPPVAVTNGAEDDWLYGWLDG